MGPVVYAGEDLGRFFYGLGAGKGGIMEEESRFTAKEVFEEMLDGVSEHGGVKEIAEATPEEFQKKVAEELGMVRFALVDILGGVTQWREDLLDILKQKFETIQEDLNMAELNFKEIGENMVLVKDLLFLLSLKTMRIEKKPVSYEKITGLADVLKIDLEDMAEDLRGSTFKG